MKNQIKISILLLCLMSKVSFGQICEGIPLLMEDFATELPTNWTVLDLDGEALRPSMISRGYSSEWTSQNHLAEKCVGVSSYFGTGAMADDYLISPAINIPTNSSVCLSFKAALGRNFFPEKLDILVSTTGATVDGLNDNVLLSLTDEDIQIHWATFTADLSNFGGQTIHLGFHHKTAAGFATLIDDVRISKTVPTDLALKEIQLENVIRPSTTTIKGTVLNGGTTAINSFSLNWKVNNGTTNTTTYNNLNLAVGDNLNFAHPIPWISTMNGTYQIETWLSNCNGNSDTNPTNDKLISTVFVNTYPRKVLLEEFTQASCPPCAIQNPRLDSLIEFNRAAGKLNALKYHTVWPGYDPMYEFSAEFSNERTAYYQVMGVPNVFLDGKVNLNCDYYIGAPVCVTQHYIDSIVQKPSIFQIQATTSASGMNLTVSSQITALTNIPAGRFALHNVLYEDMIDFQGQAPGTNGETIFAQVVKTMLPNAGGQLLPAMQTGESLIYTYTTPITSDYNPVELRFLNFVQDNSDQCIYQSNDMPTVFTNTIETNRYNQIKITPNPATNHLQITLPDDTNNIIMVELSNLLGQSVKRFSIQEQVSKLNITDVSDGIYFVKFYDKNSQLLHSKKLVVYN